jgi:hypothetical protein
VSVGSSSFTDEIIHRAEKLLAKHVGPLAKMLVRQAVQNAKNHDEFIASLAAEIDSSSKKKKFVAAMRT